MNRILHCNNRKLPFRRTHIIGAARLAVVLVALVASLSPTMVEGGGGGALFAQDRAIFEDGIESGGGSWLQWNSWPMKVALTFLLVLLACILGYFVLFQSLLGKQNPTWPLKAYGIANCLILLVITIGVIAIFKDDLYLHGDATTGVTALNKYGPKIGVAVIGGLLAFAMLFIFRSNEGRRA